MANDRNCQKKCKNKRVYALRAGGHRLELHNKVGK